MGCETSSSSGDCGQEACGSGLKVLLSSLTDDIYVTTVGSLVASYSAAAAAGPAGCRIFRLPMVVPSLLFTILLQMALVGLLWQAAVTGDAPVERPEEGRLWVQLGHAYQRICNVSDRAQVLEAKMEQLHGSLGKGAKWNAKVMQKKTKHSQCLQSMWDSDDNSNVEPDSIPECLQMDVDTMDNDQKCRKFLLRRRRTDLEFGWGMYARGSNYVADTNQEYHRIGYEYDPTSFIIMAFIALVIAVHDEIRRAIKLCTVAAALTGILPAFFGRERYWVPAEKKLPKLQGALVLITPVLQLLVALAVLLTGGVLFLFEAATTDRISIITNSVALCFVLELDNKVGAIVRAQMLWHVTEEQPDKGSKILEDYIAGVPADAAAAAAAAAAAQGGMVGLLVFTEALLLAPQCNLQALAMFSIIREYGFIPDAAFYGMPEEGGLMDKFFADTRINPSEWFSENAWMAFAWGGFTQVKNYLSGPENIHRIKDFNGVGMCAAYICIVAIMIFLLFKDLLPCSQTTHPVHLWWPNALMLGQIMVAIGALTQYDLNPQGTYVAELAEYIWYPAIDSHKNVLAFFFCWWGFIFVAWPLQFHYKSSCSIGAE
ncbi:hypothetical protein OEZ86_002356 [Tetradesmus obliquus]|nr:hypothetical protein OEZ86_002356 [Tetradesmus obliquus]